MSFLQDIYDVGLSPIRGVAGFAEGLYDFADFVAFDALPDSADNFGMGTSKTVAGGFIEEATKFSLGFFPGLGVASKVGKVTGLTSKVAQTSKTTQMVAKAGKAVAVGGAVDFTLYEAHEERLSDLIQKIPALQNPVTAYLASDDTDGEFEGRLKNVLEGGILGGVADSVVAGVRAIKKGRKIIEAGGSPEEAAEVVQKALDETPEAFDNIAANDLDPITGKPADDLSVDPDAPTLDIRDVEGIEKGSQAVLDALSGVRVYDDNKPGSRKMVGSKKGKGALGINVPRSTKTAERMRMIKLFALNAKDVYEDLLENPTKFADMEGKSEEQIQELIEKAMLTGEAAGSRGYSHFVKTIMEEAKANTAVLEGVQGNILATERLAQTAMDAMRDIAKTAQGGTIEDKARFLKAMSDTNAMWEAVQNESMASGRLLTSRRIVKRDSKLLPSDAISREVDFQDPDAIEAIVKEQGGEEAVDKMIVDLLDAERPEDFYKVIKNKDNFGVRLLTDYYMSTILSGPTTHLVNAVSNTITALYLPAERALGAAFTGNKALAKSELSVYGNMLSSLSDSFKAMQTAFKEGDTRLGSTTRDDSQQNALQTLVSRGSKENPDASTIDKIIGITANAVSASSRGLAASDGFFKTLTYQSRVKTMLTNDGMARGLQGEELAKFVASKTEKIIGDGQFYTYSNVRRQAEALALKETNDPEQLGVLINEYMNEMWDDSLSPLAKAALDHSEYATFTKSLTDANRGVVAQASGGVQRWINDWPLMRLVFPFVRTPVNLMTFAGERVYTKPAKGWKQGKSFIDMPMAEKSKKQLFEEYRNPDMRADAIGRTVTGYGIMITGFAAVSAGKVSGGGPQDPESRRLMEAEGWQPYSVKVGDKWISYRRFDPFSTLIGLIADYHEAEATDDGRNQTMLTNVGMAIATSVARNITNKSYLSGATRVANVMAEPDRYMGSFAQQQISAFSPFSSLGNQVNQAIDPDLREVRSVLDALKAKIPGMSESLDPRRNVLGEVIKRPNTPAGFLPFSYTEVKDDVILNEFAELGHGFSPPKPETNGLNLTDYNGPSGRTAYDRWLQLHGEVRVNGRTLRQELRKLIKSRDYQNLSADSLDQFDSPRVGSLRRVVGKYRRAAYQEMLGEFPEIQQLDAQNTKIKQYRAKGLDDAQIQSIINF